MSELLRLLLERGELLLHRGLARLHPGQPCLQPGQPDRVVLVVRDPLLEHPLMGLEHAPGGVSRGLISAASASAWRFSAACSRSSVRCCAWSFAFWACSAAPCFSQGSPAAASSWLPWAVSDACWACSAALLPLQRRLLGLELLLLLLELLLLLRQLLLGLVELLLQRGRLVVLLGVLGARRRRRVQRRGDLERAVVAHAEAGGDQVVGLPLGGGRVGGADVLLPELEGERRDDQGDQEGQRDHADDDRVPSYDAGPAVPHPLALLGDGARGTPAAWPSGCGARAGRGGPAAA